MHRILESEPRILCSLTLILGGAALSIRAAILALESWVLGTQAKDWRDRGKEIAWNALGTRFAQEWLRPKTSPQQSLVALE